MQSGIKHQIFTPLSETLDHSAGNE